MRALRLVACGMFAVLAGGAAQAAEPGPGGPVISADAILEQADTLRPEVLDLALEAYHRAVADGLVRRQRLTIIDYELPSYKKRLWVVDMETGRLMYEEWVAHGMGRPRGSGGDMEHALAFSNEHGTRKSSLGLYTTAETYRGKHGYSLKLDGQENGINHRARERAIVMHSAHYVTADRADDRLIGRSWGCPAVRPAISKELIDAIKDGSVVWIYYPNQRWLETSTFLDRVRAGISALRTSIGVADGAPTR